MVLPRLTLGDVLEGTDPPAFEQIQGELLAANPAPNVVDAGQARRVPVGLINKKANRLTLPERTIQIPAITPAQAQATPPDIEEQTRPRVKLP